MSETWYEVAAAGQPLTQGDVIRSCRVLAWRGAVESVALSDWAVEQTIDAVVMTQACDLEHRKVANVVLCRVLPLSAYRQVWDARMAQRKQNPSDKAWRRTLDDIAAGYVWNESLLDRSDEPNLGAEVSVVEFHDLYTIPRVYLESLLVQRGRPRLRLRPPYREQLSQSFARFFMRVGLPQAVQLPA